MPHEITKRNPLRALAVGRAVLEQPSGAVRLSVAVERDRRDAVGEQRATAVAAPLCAGEIS